MLEALRQAGNEHRPVEQDNEPLLSIVVPALNERVTIGEFVRWCWEGFDRAGVTGEVIIVDSSTDDTGDIAESLGARVIRVPKRGLGRAYIDALPQIRGRYVILGDCDLTYDFREIQGFIELLRNGSEFVIGSRMKGLIEPGAMPPLHRYFGTPLTTWILNSIYGARFSDIHCGMRALTLDAFRRLDLQSQGWEYASEMLLKAVRMKLRIGEVPISFFKDRPGRSSHHKRAGWLSPWLAGWTNLRVMFLYAPDFFVLRPGLLTFILGLSLTSMLAGGPIDVDGFQLNLHWMLLGVTLATLGYSAVQLGVLARVYYNFDPSFTEQVRHIITYNRGVVLACGTGLVGVLLNTYLVAIWLHSGLRLAAYYHPGILGLLLIIFGFQTFVFTLMFEMIANGASR
jgi:glycosyltransferase involved in cell wall biosynthesis